MVFQGASTLLCPIGDFSVLVLIRKDNLLSIKSTDILMFSHLIFYTFQIPCAPGMYGELQLATKSTDCLRCPVNTYNHQNGQKVCRPCGTSAIAPLGSITCSCIGKNRAFQISDGACVCKLGYVFYDEQDSLKTEENSDLDCQEMVSFSPVINVIDYRDFLQFPLHL